MATVTHITVSFSSTSETQPEKCLLFTHSLPIVDITKTSLAIAQLCRYQLGFDCACFGARRRPSWPGRPLAWVWTESASLPPSPFWVTAGWAPCGGILCCTRTCTSTRERTYTRRPTCMRRPNSTRVIVCQCHLCLQAIKCWHPMPHLLFLLYLNHFIIDAHLHQEALFNHEAHLHQGGLLHQDNQSPLLHHEPKSKASLRVSERTWESRRIKEEMQGIVSPTPLELHKVSPGPLLTNSSQFNLYSPKPGPELFVYFI